ncbi:PLC-like phosphodiesterase [Mycena indigotica]|uniref:PLC-like phosphodiesterase n=1 Tax=Mycena indigotica TaxID=2126181 RepID=A0A8H6S856_9AGAR|nr:PLC-like phosphodiesterase [Mycena indigotica]KAF7294681.1 PLC-like phosphodiesterase [Mycena indigotica]
MLFFFFFVFAALGPVIVFGAQKQLGQDALNDILARGAPILGIDNGCSRTSKTCDWMRNVPDHTKLVHMNLPGTHDSATWNYSQATQDSLIRYTGPNVPPAVVFRCQNQSLLDSLNAGIRVFDLRFAYNPGMQRYPRFSSWALLAPTATVDDVWFGLYNWLDKHPTEAVLISLNYESGTGMSRDLKLEQLIYNLMTSNLASRYWVQANGTLGTLGEARGKLTFLQRYNYQFLPNTESKQFGIHLAPEQWTDNSPSIEIVYNNAAHQSAFIEDYYEIGLPNGAGVAENVQWKLNATIAHLENATTLHPDQLYITFASSEHNDDVPPENPIVMALGDGSVPGVNQKLLPWLQQHRGKRFGVIMLDFFGAVPGLVEAVIGV